MIRPGFFIFPVHEPTLCRELIRDTQPSLVKVWASVTSAGQLADWRALPHVLVTPASLGRHVL